MIIHSLNNPVNLSNSIPTNNGAGNETVAIQGDLQKQQNISKTSSEANTSNQAKEDTLNQQLLQEVQTLSARDREVRAHEAAHKAASGNLTGAVTYTYTQGPDGKRYATGGEVSVDTSAVKGNPEATVRKAARIRAAALAPATPSNQDRAVALEAAQMAVEAQAQMVSQKEQEPQSASDDSDIDTENKTQENSPSDHNSAIPAAPSRLNADKIAAYNATSKTTTQPAGNINLLV